MDKNWMDSEKTTYNSAWYAHIILKDKEDQRPFPSSDGKSSISNMHAADDAFTLQSGAQRQLKEERQQEIKDRIVARKEAAKESRLSAAVDTQALKTSEMKVSI